MSESYSYFKVTKSVNNILTWNFIQIIKWCGFLDNFKRTDKFNFFYIHKTTIELYMMRAVNVLIEKNFRHRKTGKYVYRKEWQQIYDHMCVNNAKAGTEPEGRWMAGY